MSKKDLLTYFYVQYYPCGHVRQIRLDEEDLLAMASRRLAAGYLSPMQFGSEDCPTCYVEESIELEEES